MSFSASSSQIIFAETDGVAGPAAMSTSPGLDFAPDPQPAAATMTTARRKAHHIRRTPSPYAVVEVLQSARLGRFVGPGVLGDP